jgi:SOS-response transcriptional repressor LexA
MGAPFRPVAPAAPLRRDEVLAFLVERIARTGICPTIADVAAGMELSNARVRELVGQLVERGIIEKTPGAQRNLRVRDVAHSRSIVMQTMLRLGWPIAEPMGALQQPCPKEQLPIMPPFEHLPDFD